MESPLVVVTGANGFVGSHVLKALVEAGARVRAVVRRPGTALAIDGVEEHVGKFQDREFAARVLKDARAAVTTAHPMWSDLETQRRVGVEGTAAFVRTAREAGVERLVHLSTAAVYFRPLDATNVDERSPLVGDDGSTYAVTKRNTDAALAEITGITGIFIRPPMILGPGETSEFNTIRPAAMAEEKAQRRVNPDKGITWIHVADLAALISDLAVGRIPLSDDPARGPVEGAWTPLNAAAGRITARDYFGTVVGALGVEPDWSDEPVSSGQMVADRARAWGWTPAVGAAEALAEVAECVRAAT